MSTAEKLARAIETHQRGELKEAFELYRGVLQDEPGNVDALHYFGVLAHQVGDSDKAVTLIRAALEIDPGYAAAHNNLGNVLRGLRRLDEAAAAYERVLELEPAEPSALNNLGSVYHALDRGEEALALYDRAVAARPDHPAAHVNRGHVLRSLGRVQEALDAYLRGAELHRWSPQIYRGLGFSLYVAGRAADALRVFRMWLEIAPESPVARHMVAACSGTNVPPRASDEYVREYFGGFASTFDRVLGELEYRAPELVAASLAAAADAPDRSLDILDAGCGTGLCGPLLRPYARRLVGVDLADAMVERARSRSTYDELVTAELSGYLAAQPAAFDVIASADVLVYFGDLAGVAAAARAALRPGGRLVFTLERAADEPDGFHINPHGRFSHGEAYVRRVLAAAGLVVEDVGHEVLRKETDQDVAGLVVRARR